MSSQDHPARTRLRGVDGYNPRNLQVSRTSEDRDRITGSFIDDSPSQTFPKRPEIPFDITLWPLEFRDWQGVNRRVRSQIQSGQPRIEFRVGPQKSKSNGIFVIAKGRVYGI